MPKIADRTLDVFEMFGRERQPLNLSDLSRLLRIPMSSCHDLVRTLQSRGYLYEIGPRAGYYPTARLKYLGTSIVDDDPLLKSAEMLLRTLRDALDESIFLSKAHGFQATYLMVFEATQPLRVMRKVGDEVGPLYAKSAGKALLARLDPRARAEYFKSTELTALTDRTKVTEKTIMQEVDEGLARGWFSNNGDSLDGVGSISASFVWNGGIYIVTVAAPMNRIEKRMEEIAIMVTNICKVLEQRSEAF